LILPPGHAETIASRRRLSTRERWMVGAVLGAVVALAIAVAISIGSSGRASRHGCIYVTIPAATGAEEVYRCGAEARSTCSSARTPGVFSEASARAIAAQCRKAGLPVRQ
jgi:hypothetical protein